MFEIAPRTLTPPAISSLFRECPVSCTVPTLNRRCRLLDTYVHTLRRDPIPIAGIGCWEITPQDLNSKPLGVYIACCSRSHQRILTSTKSSCWPAARYIGARSENPQPLLYVVYWSKRSCPARPTPISCHRIGRDYTAWGGFRSDRPLWLVTDGGEKNSRGWLTVLALPRRNVSSRSVALSRAHECVHTHTQHG